MAPPTTTSTQPWSIVAAVFITLFTLVLLLGSWLVLRHLRLAARKNQPKPEATTTSSSFTSRDLELGHISAPPLSSNPHPFGVQAWHDHEHMQAAQAERDALKTASLETQVDLLEEAAEMLDKALELAEARNKQLTLELADERRRYRPVERAVQAAPSPTTTATKRHTLQADRLQDVVHRNSKKTPERRAQLEMDTHPVSPQSASVEDAAADGDDPFADGAEEEDGFSSVDLSARG